MCSDERRGGLKAGRYPMRRVPLTCKEILELDAAIIQAFTTIQGLRDRYTAARHIKFPPLPQILTESIVILCAEALFGTGWKATYGGIECDVRIENASGTLQKVEVKATAEHAFQEFKAKDLCADVLTWVRFGRRYREGQGPIEVLLLRQPGLHISKPCRLDKHRFERLVGQTTDLRTLTFPSLDALLRAATVP